MLKPAYSYIRFSSAEQAKGDSHRRQRDQAQEWAAANGYEIRDTLEDLGVSAFRLKNLKEGPLAGFLQLAREGSLPDQAVLLVESLDRLSRAKVSDVLPEFLALINAGVGVVTLADKRLYTRETIDNDTFQLFASLVVMTRAHEESRMKGERVGARWAKKREQARTSAANKLTGVVPTWLDVNRDAAGNRVFTPNQHVETIERIFTETVQGFGRRALARRLNRDGVKTLRGEFGWHSSTVDKILHGKAVLGEYQPHRRDANGKRVPEGDAIKGYYPAVIPQELWDRAQAAIAMRNLKKAETAGRPGAEGANLIPTLARCACCGGRMKLVNKGPKPKGGRYYACESAIRAMCGNARHWPHDLVERVLMHLLPSESLRELAEPPDPDKRPSSEEHAGNVADLGRQLENAVELSTKHRGGPLGLKYEAKAEDLEARIRAEEAKRDAAKRAESEAARRDPAAAQWALEKAAMFAARLAGVDDDERIEIRQVLVRQLRAAFHEVQFSATEVAALVALPGKPRQRPPAARTEGRLPSAGLRLPAMPKPIIVRSERVVREGKAETVDRYYWRHLAYSEDPDTVASRVDDPSVKVKAVLMGFDETMRRMALASSLPEGQASGASVASAQVVLPPAVDLAPTGPGGGLARLRRLAERESADDDQ